MKIAYFVLLVLALLQMPVGSSGQEPVGKMFDESVWLTDLMSSLPVKFLVTEHNLTGAELELQPMTRGAGSITRYKYVSQSPIQETTGGRIFLKAEMLHIQYKDVQKASAAMLETKIRAHPDMGLSYAWDYLLLNKDSIYHLHASCLFSKDWFEQMTSALNKHLSSSGEVPAMSIFCRCGGGCGGRRTED